MKIDAHGAVREASAGSDFRAGHALDQSKNKSFAIAFGEGEDGVESGAGFDGGVRRGRRGRRRRAVFCSSGFFDEFVKRFVVTVKVGSAVAGDGGEPAGEFGDFAEGGEAREGLEENVMDEIVDVGVGNAREKDAVDHTGVTRVEEAEGRAIALLGGAYEGVVGAMVT
jgi:hypothetical protein